MTVLSFIAMYILMYAMVDTLGNVFNNINQVYMAALMASPMVLIELVEKYSNKNLNRIILAASVVAGLGFFLAIRQQVAVTDSQFLRSMIPHHSGAVLMCAKAPIQSPEIKNLCRTIISGQDAEIKQMRALLGK